MRALIIGLSLCLGACSYLSRTPPEPTLSDLQPARLPETDAGLPSVSLAELEAIYREVLAVSPDPETRIQVLHRLADIEMSRAEGELLVADGSTAVPLFEQAIESYRALLAANPEAADNDQLLYQLSKAYDLGGRTGESVEVLEQLSSDYPASPHFTEAEFRVAESYFAAGRYQQAESAYRRVVEQGVDTAYYQNALYMYGWAQFKQGQYRRSISAFTNTLDLLLPPDNDLEVLRPGQRELVEDSFRVLAVIFSYLEGAETIAAAYDQLGHRSYQFLLYEHLGQLYLKQQRYRDSAETYRAYNRLYPASIHAHRFQVAVIDIYQAGGFPDLILQEKQHYIDAYGVGGEYWNQSGAELRAEIDSRRAATTSSTSTASAKIPGCRTWHSCWVRVAQKPVITAGQ
jgi:tetratricopeptide (TPR) repeat protein